MATAAGLKPVLGFANPSFQHRRQPRPPSALSSFQVPHLKPTQLTSLSLSASLRKSHYTSSSFTVATSKPPVLHNNNNINTKTVVCCAGGAGSFFFAAVRSSRPTGALNTPLTVIAAGLAKWLDMYSGVLMVRCLLSWFPNIPWERQPLCAIRDLCDPFLNLFKSILPPLFDAVDLSPLLAFSVLGAFGAILNHGRGAISGL